MHKSKCEKFNEILNYEYILTDELRELLKKPIGFLISNENLTYNEIKHYIDENGIIITVGDATTERLIQLGIIPSIQIVDGKEMRANRPLPLVKMDNEIKALNPAGRISKEALIAISSALKANKPVRIVIDGEEDLLTLPCIVLSPYGSSVLYGQPKEGIVIIKVSKASKRMAISFMKKMMAKSSSNKSELNE
ncbi:MAG: DUF359 domain-containing protein [Nitrososphaerales archaeon]